MHNGRIWQAAIDRAEKILVTGSDDKTVRVWNLQTGRLLQVLRPPIGDETEGRIDGVAISPDGETIAAAGRTGYQWDHSESVYILDRTSGQMKARITGLEHTIDRLWYSPDGNLLLVCLHSTGGIRVYRQRDLSPVFEDGQYADSVYGGDFTPDSRRLVTSSADGFIRLYDVTSGRLIMKRKAPVGQPYGIRFSPDETRVAVAYDAVPRVDILSAADLSPQRSMQLPSQVSTGFREVAWSLDGRYIYAGGRYESADRTSLIVRWPAKGIGPGYKFDVADNTITGLLALAGGHLLYTSADPRWGITDENGKSIVRVVRNSANFIHIDGALNVSNDGLQIGFPYDASTREHAVFSLSQRSLTTDQPGQPSLSGPLQSGLNVTDFYNFKGAKLNGSLIKPGDNEISRCLAIAPDLRSFALGTDSNLRLFDRTGTLRWQIPAPGSTRAVNIPRNAPLVIAAFLDGTVRWYRLSDGKELLAFFPFADRRRWVLWSPDGYYDASPGGDSLIGWHVNRGASEVADFFPVSHFRASYYRPETIARALSPGAELTPVPSVERSIAKSLPPVVKILSPEDGASISSPDFAIQYSAVSPGGEPVTAVRILLDGRPLRTDRSTQPVLRGTQGERGVHVDEKDPELSVIAENRFGASEPATVHLHWGGTQSFLIQPKLYILAIGISAYPHPYELSFAARDAQNFVDALAPQKGRLYRDMETKVLTDQRATRDNILDGLEWIERNTTQHDVAMIFLAGHGEDDPNGTYYFMPVNFDPNALKRTAVDFSEIRNTVHNLAGKVLSFVDTCHSGDVMGPRSRSGPSDINAVINELSSAENGAIVFAASTGKQSALERTDWGDGAFTKALVEGLQGKADYNHTGRITINMLDLYISERVKQLTDGKQTPSTTKPETITDFPVALVR